MSIAWIISFPTCKCSETRYTTYWAQHTACTRCTLSNIMGKAFKGTQLHVPIMPSREPRSAKEPNGQSITSDVSLHLRLLKLWLPVLKQFIWWQYATHSREGEIFNRNITSSDYLVNIERMDDFPVFFFLLVFRCLSSAQTMRQKDENSLPRDVVVVCCRIKLRLSSQFATVCMCFS